MNYMILSMGSGVRGSVRGPFFTRHPFLHTPGSHIVFAALEPELTDCPPFAVGFWNNPKCHMNYLDYL